MTYIVDPVFEADTFEDATFTGVWTDKVDHFDLTAKCIHIRAGVLDYHPVDDLYKELRYHRAHDESLRIFSPWIEAAGNVPKGGGKFTARLAILKNGWKVVPADVSHTLRVTGEQISDIGESGVQLMNLLPLSPGVNVSIEYAPPDTEIIVLDTTEEVAAAIWANPIATQLAADMSFLKAIEGGRWKIVSNQMVFYEEDNVTEVARFDLLDAAGNPTTANVFERTRV